MPPNYYADDDDELGFIGAALTAATGAAKGIGKIAKVFKKKKAKKKGKGKVTELASQTIEGEVAKAARGKIKRASKGMDPNDVRGIVREVVSTVPPPVRQIVLEALRAYRDETAASLQARNALTEQLDAALKPDIAAMLAVLQAQQLQGSATHEHRELVAREEFRAKTRDGLNSIADRLQELKARLQTVESRLNKSAIVSPNRVPVFGARNVLDG